MIFHKKCPNCMKISGFLFSLLVIFFSCCEKKQVRESSQKNIIDKEKMFIKMDENTTNIQFKNLLPEKEASGLADKNYIRLIRRKL